jgi:hypothetical protein
VRQRPASRKHVSRLILPPTAHFYPAHFQHHLQSHPLKNPYTDPTLTQTQTLSNNPPQHHLQSIHKHPTQPISLVSVRQKKNKRKSRQTHPPSALKSVIQNLTPTPSQYASVLRSSLASQRGKTPQVRLVRFISNAYLIESSCV